MIFPLTVNNDTRNQEIDIQWNHNKSPTNRRQQVIEYISRLFEETQSLTKGMQS